MTPLNPKARPGESPELSCRLPELCTSHHVTLRACTILSWVLSQKTSARVTWEPSLDFICWEKLCWRHYDRDLLSWDSATTAGSLSTRITHAMQWTLITEILNARRSLLWPVVIAAAFICRQAEQLGLVRIRTQRQLSSLSFPDSDNRGEKSACLRW